MSREETAGASEKIEVNTLRETGEGNEPLKVRDYEQEILDYYERRGEIIK